MQFRASDTALTASSYRTTGFVNNFDSSNGLLDANKYGAWDASLAKLTLGTNLEETDAQGGMGGTVDFYDPLNASTKPTFLTHVQSEQDGGNVAILSVGGYYNVATAISGFTLEWQNHDCDAGTFTLSGVKK